MTKEKVSRKSPFEGGRGMTAIKGIIKTEHKKSGYTFIKYSPIFFIV